MVQKSQALAIQQFDQIGISSMITRTTSDIANLERTIGMVFQMIVPAPLIVIVSIIMTVRAHAAMALIQFLFRPCGLCPQAFGSALPHRAGSPGPN